MKIVCSACASDPQVPDAVVIAVQPDDEYAACPQCAARYRLLTRAISEIRVRRRSQALASYDIQTVEASGRLRLRTLVAQPGISLRGGRWITVVWRHHRLVGIADQGQASWWPVVLPATVGRVAPLWRALLAVCAALAVLQAARLAGALDDLVDQQPSALVALLVVTAAAAAPALWWSLRPARAAASGQTSPAAPVGLDLPDDEDDELILPPRR